MSLRHFSDRELASPDTGLYCLASGFGPRLDELRFRVKAPIIVTGGARSKEHNVEVGGHPRSLHVYDVPFWDTGGCCAVDVADTRGSAYRAHLVGEALEMGFSVGINIAKKFIHIDDRSRCIGREKVLFYY